MMTQPIQKFETLSSETPPAGGNDLTKTGYSFEERRRLEMRARYARADMVAEHVVDAILWVGRQLKRLPAAIKADYKLRAAEAQLHRMSDRELADIGLSRGDIPFAIREVPYGLAPEIDGPTGATVAANQNLRHAA